MILKTVRFHAQILLSWRVASSVRYYNSHVLLIFAWFCGMKKRCWKKLLSNSFCDINELGENYFSSTLLSDRHCFCAPVLLMSITVELLMMVDHKSFLSEVHIGQLSHMPHNQDLLYCFLQQLLEVTHHL